MKIRTLIATGVLVVGVAAAPASAQVSSFQATVPFPFVVGSQTLPAGTYVVQRYLGRPRSADDTSVIVMKAANHHIYKVIVTGSSDQPRAARAQGSQLVFTSFKGKQYLHRVSVAGDGGAHQLAGIPPEIQTQATSEVIVTGFQYSREK